MSLNNDKTRAGLYAVAAAYLLYLGFGLFRNREDTAMTPVLRWLFIALFAAAAVGLAVYAVRLWKKGVREEAELLKAEEEAGPETPDAGAPAEQEADGAADTGPDGDGSESALR